MTDEYFEKGLELRRKMLGGKAGADDKLESASDFIRPLEEWVTRQCFGEAWHRPALDHRTRSMITLSMLVSMGVDYQVKNHVLGAIANGVTVDEIREIFMHSIIYCGLPQAVDAFLSAEQVLKEAGHI